jgi:hypothetical protein
VRGRVEDRLELHVHGTSRAPAASTRLWTWSRLPRCAGRARFSLGTGLLSRLPAKGPANGRAPLPRRLRVRVGYVHGLCSEVAQRASAWVDEDYEHATLAGTPCPRCLVNKHWQRQICSTRTN